MAKYIVSFITLNHTLHNTSLHLLPSADRSLLLSKDMDMEMDLVKDMETLRLLSA